MRRLVGRWWFVVGGIVVAFVVASTRALPAVASAQAGADPEKGKAVFEQCAACRQHLGWLFRAGTAGFHGLILDRLLEVDEEG